MSSECIRWLIEFGGRKSAVAATAAINVPLGYWFLACLAKAAS